MFLILQNFTCFVAAKMYNKYCVWILGLFWIFVINLMKQESNSELATVLFNINISKINQLVIIMAWIMLRGISFGLENFDYVKLNFRDSTKFSFVCFLGYAMYFPTLAFGPNIIYSRYLKMLSTSCDGHEDTIQRLVKLLINIVRYSFWFLFTNFCLHFFYIHSIQYNAEVSFPLKVTFAILKVDF